jgi:hypothetical protein
MTKKRAWRRLSWFRWDYLALRVVLTLAFVVAAAAGVTRTYVLFLIVAAIIVATIIGLGAFYYFLPPRGWKRQPLTPKS